MSEIKNISASVKTRLKNIARANGIDFNQLITRYVQERFLYRLSISPLKNNLVLKGALMLLAYQLPDLRPTSDIDFLGMATSNDPENIKEILKQICLIEYKDGIDFSGGGIIVKEIKKNAEYKGARASIPWNIGKMHGSLQLDIGFGDRIHNGPAEMDFPVLLKQPKPRILVYSKETMISEKFQTIVSLNFETSRLKDFYDIYHLCTTSSFKLEELLSALHITFENRGTSFENIRIIFEDDFKNSLDMDNQWKRFLERNRIKLEMNFVQVIEKLETFFIPLIEDKSDSKMWIFNRWVWE